MTVDDETLRDISRYDNHGGGGVTYEEACELHFQGLKSIIEEHDGHVIWSEHYWYPMEAVELRGYTPEQGKLESLGVAILVLLIDDLESGDRDHLAMRTDDRYLNAYLSLPSSYSDLIMEALQVLEEQI